jgi:hypothetical protein
MAAEKHHGSFGFARAVAASRRRRSLLDVLVLVLGVWNGYFLIAFCYQLSIETTRRTSVPHDVTAIWFCGDAVMALGSCAVWAILRARRGASEPAFRSLVGARDRASRSVRVRK